MPRKLSRSVSERAAGHLGLLLAGLLVGLLAAEGLVRALDLPPHPLAPLPVGSYRLSDDPVLRYEYVPNLSSDHAGFDSAHVGLRTNSFGFRDVEWPREKPAGTVRILAIGDSTTLGLGVPELADTYPKRLEARLRRTLERPVEVLNLGVGGYDPLQEAQLLRVRGLALEPDVVLMQVTMNDLESGFDGGVYEALLRAREHLDAPALRGFVLRHSRLAFFGLHRVRSMIKQPRRSRARASAATPLEEGLVLLRQLKEEHGFQTLVFLLPGLKRPAADYRFYRRHRRMTEIAARVGGLEWIDLLDGMAAASPDLSRLSFDGMHPNGEGQAVVADLVYRELRERGMP